MRIAFLCGCAEAGKDGVGDYTALLAAECRRQGHSAMIIALNDRYVTGAEMVEGLLRLGAGLTWRVRMEHARETIERFGADVISLQWVPYAFHPKGIPRGIDTGLARIAAGRVVQVMCHEIWIGAEVGASFPHRVTGAAQRSVLRRILRLLRPRIVQTSNPAYAGVLKRVGVSAAVLPLFGSIPVTGREIARDETTAKFGMFGELHPEWSPEPLLGHLRGLGGRIEIEHIGRIGKGLELWENMERQYGREIGFKRHSEQPAARISQFLMEMDFGISTTPLALLGKSGTLAAMLEHGLPVVVNRNDVRFAGVDEGPPPDGTIVMDDGLITALREARRRPAASTLPQVATRFLESLQTRRAETS